MNRQNGDAPLIATNDDAFQSKVSAMQAGYFEDFALSRMAEKYSGLRTGFGGFRRPPIINRGTYARMLLKETLVEAFLRHSREAGKVAQIISLGAGFDTHPFELSDNAKMLPQFHYVELDFPQVVKDKITLMDSTFSGKDSVFTACTCQKEQSSASGIIHRKEHPTAENTADTSKDQSPQLREEASLYSMKGVDLRDIEELSSVVDGLDVHPEAPTLILAEIVLVYMQPQDSDKLISFFSNRFTGSRAFMTIEHTLQESEFGRQMVQNIASRGSPLLGLNCYPSIRSQEARFKKLGWHHVRAQSLLEAFEKRIQNRLALNKIEMLDELEEWRLIMTHYCVVCATSGAGGVRLLNALDLTRYQDVPFRSYKNQDKNRE
ncbi:Leucine carboxyl methyltransferase 1 [Gracilariopsis chorda]|uniref:Leucine carboxyl methyltransferase 1 n=1 Tax=Gracilariopsis chorda TaxID=448386 RepID=A0A2V3ISS8_9FLOR|nr:Leucine carboxyl methyltransferase 1 [Gracilariopsis chorda]|eukprot:PXF45164.1 Leucine carboxyl methyltransferase 1 [Gracilariopsis chorda]